MVWSWLIGSTGVEMLSWSKLRLVDMVWSWLIGSTGVEILSWSKLRLVDMVWSWLIGCIDVELFLLSWSKLSVLKEDISPTRKLDSSNERQKIQTRRLAVAASLATVSWHCLTQVLGKSGIHATLLRPMLLWPQRATLQVFTSFNRAWFIARCLRHPFLRKC